MIPFHPHRFTLALLAQIVFCLVAAPILSAERWAALPPPPSADQKHDASRDDSRPVIRLAFDASDVRPEEVSGAEQRRGNSGPRNGQSTGSAARGGEPCSTVLDTPLVEWDDAFFRESEARWDRLDQLIVVLELDYSRPAGPYRDAEIDALTFAYISSPLVIGPRYHVDPAAWYDSVERAFHPLTLCLFAPEPPAPYFIRLERFTNIQPTGPPGV